jgi:hypothetical protein
MNVSFCIPPRLPSVITLFLFIWIRDVFSTRHKSEILPRIWLFRMSSVKSKQTSAWPCVVCYQNTIGKRSTVGKVLLWVTRLQAAATMKIFLLTCYAIWFDIYQIFGRIFCFYIQEWILRQTLEIQVPILRREERDHCWGRTNLPMKKMVFGKINKLFWAR